MLYSSTWPLIGHEWAVNHIARMLNHERNSHAYLISGPASIGKTTFARAFAMALNCEADEGRPCGECRACLLIANNAHADVSIVQADGSSLKIEQVRDLQHSLSLHPVEARCRVTILRRFHEATPQAMDSLLKTLEEPPPYVVLLLTADATDSLLPTIRSRCQPLKLRPIPMAQVRDALQKQFNVEPDRATLLAHLSGGRIGWAIRAAADESMLTQRTELLDILEDLLGQSRVGRFAVADKLSKDRMLLLTALDLWQSYWRDVLLIVHSTTVATITNRDRRHALDQIARTLSVEAIYGTLQALRRTARYIDENVNARLATEVLMLDLPQLRLFPAP